MSMRRNAKRYLRSAERTTRDLQEFLEANPAVASAGSLLLNAVMQSKYGPTLQRLMSAGASMAPKPAESVAEEWSAEAGEAA